MPHANAPRCYDSIEDFQEKWHQCVYDYSLCIDKFLKERLRDSHIWGTLRLIWLEPDLIMNGAFNIQAIKDELIGYLLEATSGMGVEWCERVNREVIEDVCLTCQTYIAATKHHANLLDSNFMTHLACLEARTKLGSLNLAVDGMPLYWQHFGAIDDLIKENCVTNVTNNEIVSFYTKTERNNVITQIIMTSRRDHCTSPFNMLDTDLVLKIIRHAFISA